MNALAPPATTTTTTSTATMNSAPVSRSAPSFQRPRHQRVEMLCRSARRDYASPDADDVDVSTISSTRRKAMMVTTAAFASMMLSNEDRSSSSNNNNNYAFAAESAGGNNTTTYTDDVLKFSISYPTDSWKLLVGETGGSGDRSGSRQVIAFAPKNANPKDVNISLVATPVGADYPKMGSFGSPFEFGFNLVNPMNKPKARKGREDEVQYSELIEAGSKGLNYFVEYELTRPSTGIDSKQLVVAGIGYDGRVSHLYSTTAQMPRGEEEKWRPEIEKILDSLVLPPPLYN